jgi:hypothetical protein
MTDKCEHDWEFLTSTGGLGGGDADWYQCRKCMKIKIEHPLDALFG